MSLQDNIRMGLLSEGGYTSGPHKNTPAQYGDKKTPYYADVTEIFTQEYARYASDYMGGTLQYFDENGGMVFEDVTFRFANVVNPSAAIQRHFDDYKIVLFDQRKFDYLQPGAKLVTMGSTWIAFNPDNISSTVANGIFRRCNAVWNYLDFWGNVVSEPIIVEPERANASTPDAQNSQRISTGYYNVICQYNDFTRQVNDNTRIILGSKSYEVTGYGDFSTEFTGDYSTLRLLSFSIRVQAKNDVTDDMANHVAGGLAFDYKATIYGLDSVTIGKNTTYSVVSFRNGEQLPMTGDEAPVYTFSVDNAFAATITTGGNLTALQAGTVTITATLAQNPNIQATKEVEIIGVGSAGIRFRSQIPTSAEPYTSFEITAGIYDSGGNFVSSDYVDWTLSGANESAYSYAVNRNTITVNVFGYSATPLVITASKGALTPVSASVELCGW